MTGARRPDLENDAVVLEALGTLAPDATPRTRREARERERLAASSGARRGAAAPKAPAARPVRARPGLASRVGSRLLSFGAMLFAGALAVGMSVPANAFNPTPSAGPEAQLFAETSFSSGPAQSVEVESSEAASGEVAGIGRDAYVIKSWAEVLREKYGTRDFSYTVGTGSIRWPFPYAVPISSGFGERVAPCRGCSTYHQGLDFNPGNGAPIYAIADGVVTDREDGYGGFGNYIVITHEIDGQTVTSTYAHMQRGSSTIELGQEIKVGDFLGLVGQTGQATGPHLHFEIAVDGEKVDPFTWLQVHTN